jgi:hypothetical protein
MFEHGHHASLSPSRLQARDALLSIPDSLSSTSSIHEGEKGDAISIDDHARDEVVQFIGPVTRGKTK